MFGIDPVNGLVAILSVFLVMTAASNASKAVAEWRLGRSHRRQLEVERANRELAKAKDGVLDFLMKDPEHAKAVHHELGDRLYGRLEPFASSIERLSAVQRTTRSRQPSGHARTSDEAELTTEVMPDTEESGPVELHSVDLIAEVPPTERSIRITDN